MTAAPGPPPGAAPAGGLPARRRIAIARSGTDVAAAGGTGPAPAAGLDPAGYPAVPAGVPQAWERAQAYLGLCERYQELYQAQLAELHLPLATAPGSSLPLPHRRPRPALLTGPHTGYISLIRARRGAATRTTRLPCIPAGTRAVAVVQDPHRNVFVANERKRPYRCRFSVARNRLCLLDCHMQIGQFCERFQRPIVPRRSFKHVEHACVIRCEHADPGRTAGVGSSCAMPP